MPVSRFIINAGPNCSGGGFLGVVVLEQVFARNLLFGHVGEFEDEIDHLVFINRRTKLGQRIGIAAIVVPDFLLAAGHLARPLDHISALIEFHIRLNSSSISDGGASNLWLSSSRSSNARLTRWRVAPANSATSSSRAASLSLSSDSRPSVLANSSSIVVSPGASIRVAVVSNSAGWPASFSLA